MNPGEISQENGLGAGESWKFSICYKYKNLPSGFPLSNLNWPPRKRIIPEGQDTRRTAETWVSKMLNVLREKNRRWKSGLKPRQRQKIIVIACLTISVRKIFKKIGRPGLKYHYSRGRIKYTIPETNPSIKIRLLATPAPTSWSPLGFCHVF